jgi:hypothetical protein
MEINQQKTKKVAFIGLAVAFNFLFWQEKPGLNYLIYTLLLSVFLILLNTKKILQPKTLIPFVGTIFSAILIVLHNSIFSIWMYFISLILLIGFYNHEKLISIYYVLLTSITGFVSSLFTKLSSSSSTEKQQKNKWYKKLKLISIPLIIALVFFIV